MGCLHEMSHIVCGVGSGCEGPCDLGGESGVYLHGFPDSPGLGRVIRGLEG